MHSVDHYQTALLIWLYRFDDCLKLGRKIPEGPYTLPDPEILNVNAGPVGPSKTNRDIRDATTPAPQDIPTPLTSPSSKKPRTIQAFKGKRVMLSDDLKLGGHLKETIEELIRNSGGQITSNIEETDICICHYRKGTGYVKASQAGKDVGNLSWLYHLITHNAWTSPLRRLLHYPVPSEGIRGFKEYKISLSNYTGEARVYLENLVKATGAEFTKTFRQDNTHLITAHMGSEKCEAAKEWNINVVNHLWLEESYAKCALQTLTNHRYTHFPPRTNLGEVIGQTQIDREAVEKNYFKRETKPRKSKDIKVDNAAAKSSGIPASNFAAPRTTSNPERATPAANKSERVRSEASIQTPAANRRKDGKENETPPTTGSRGAKERAISKLHDLAPDVNQFQKEMRRSGGVIYGGKREKDTEREKPMLKPSSRESSGSKRSFDDMDVDEPLTEEEAEEATKKSKKQKKERKPPILYRMMLSKDDRWVDKQKKEAEDKVNPAVYLFFLCSSTNTSQNKLRELGIWIIEDPDRVNILCAPKIVRTRKFVAALAAAPTLVATSYLDYVLKHNKLPPPEKHPLIDREFEKVHGFRIEESLSRARQNNRRLLKNWVIFCTDGVNGGWETFRDIIEANGGSCQLYKGRASVTVSHRIINAVEDGEVSQNQEEDEPDVLYLISEPKKDEVPLWKKFRDLAKTHNMVPRIVKTEWLLFVAMAQYVHWDEKWQLNKDALESATKK